MIRLSTDGFTVTELVISITVTTLVILGITNLFVQNTQQTAVAQARTALAAETSMTLDRAANDIRLSANADATNRWADGNSPGGGASPYSWSSDADTLVLATAAEDTGGTILFSDAKNYITQKNNIIYYTQNNTLYRRVIAAGIAGNAAKTTCPAASTSATCPADRELLHNVTTFGVSYLNSEDQAVSPSDARSIELKVVTQRRLFGQNVTNNYTTRMVFRNE